MGAIVGSAGVVGEMADPSVGRVVGSGTSVGSGVALPVQATNSNETPMARDSFRKDRTVSFTGASQVKELKIGADQACLL
jgi:hypothetical protein